MKLRHVCDKSRNAYLIDVVKYNIVYDNSVNFKLVRDAVYMKKVSPQDVLQ